MLGKKIDKNGIFLEESVVGINNTDDIVFGDIPDGLYLPKWDGTKWIEGSNVLATESIKRNRVAMLEKIFNAMVLDLKYIGIDNSYMEGAETINNQYDLYEQMNKDALAGRYEESISNDIIAANSYAKQMLAELTLFVNTLRGVIWAAIDTDNDRVDDMLSLASSIKLQPKHTASSEIAILKDMFGIV